MNTELPLPPPAPAFKHKAGDVEALLSRLLTLGVLTSAAISIFGAVLYLREYHRAVVNLRVYEPQGVAFTSPAEIIHGAAQLEPLAVMQLGVLLLILTPVARVAFSLALFVIKRDWLYVVITLIVLAALAFGLVGELA